MTKEQQPLVLANPSRWPYRTAYAFALLTFIGFVGSWVQLSGAEFRRDSVLASVEQAEASGAGNSALRDLMKGYRDHRKVAAEWKRRRLGFFLAFVILLVGGFIGTGLVNLHEKMEWQVREITTLEDDDYGGH